MPSASLTKFPRLIRPVRVTPDATVLPVDLNAVPSMGVFEWVSKRGIVDGKERTVWVPRIRVEQAWLRVTEAAKLPLGLSEGSILALVRAGFVEGGRGTPHSCTVNVISLIEHVHETADDPGFWTPERIQRYRDYVEKRHKKPARNRLAPEPAATTP